MPDLAEQGLPILLELRVKNLAEVAAFWLTRNETSRSVREWDELQERIQKAVTTAILEVEV